MESVCLPEKSLRSRSGGCKIIKIFHFPCNETPIRDTNEQKGGKAHIDSMEQIYLSHAKTVYAFLLTKTQNPDLAEELTQETFYQAVKSIHKFKEQSSVSTWLCGIARNVWFDHLRKQKGRADFEEAEELAVPSAEEEVFCSWDQLSVMKLLHHLEDPMREVMYLRLTGSLTFGQIGEIMGKSENWARVTFYRGKERIVKEAKENETEHTL